MRFLTAGESHGPGVIAVIDGVPAGLAVSPADIDADLRRRQLGYGRGARQKIERDEVRITGGVRQGRTTGAPIALQIPNRDAVNWERVMSVEPVVEPPDPVTRLRPGHADLAGALKFGHEDVRRWGVVTADATQRASFFVADRMIRSRAVLGPVDVQHGLLEVDLIPAQRHELSDAQAVSVRDQNQRRIAMTVAPRSRGGTNELLDLVRSQILAAPDGSIRKPPGRQFPHESRD